MKKLFVIVILSFSLGLLLASFIAYANQTSMYTYYPSASGNYTKVHLVNGNGGLNENSSTSAFCLQTASGYDSIPTSGHTYINSGSIFADPKSGYLEVCKGDGSVASYPGASFNRFCSGSGCASCPANYTVVPNSSNPFTGVTSYSCAFTNSGSTYAKSGCFSNFGLLNSTSAPASCSSVDANAYDVGCQSFQNSQSLCTAVRTCCFNSGNVNSLSYSSSCPSTSPVNGTWTAWSACSSQCNGTETRTCTSPAPACGGTTCSGSSSQSCGGCGANQTCSSGSCVCSYTSCGSSCCSSAQTECNTSTDACCQPTSCTATYACGSTAGIDNCGHACTATAGTCPANQTCSSHSCVCAYTSCSGSCCSSAQTECNTSSDACCKPTSCTATYTCGSTAGVDNCGHACTATAGTCPANQTCSSHSCVCAYTSCSGSCCSSSQTECNTSSGSCCNPSSCAVACGTTSGTDNCGHACTGSLTPCSCPMGGSYTVAPVINNYSNNQSISLCNSSSSATVTAVSDSASGCGNPGTPSTACSPAFTVSCPGGCSTCGSTVSCSAICPSCSKSTTTNACGQTCPANCGGGNICSGGVCTPIAPPCFVSGTKILLADGKELPVERLKAGDVLLGSGGAHNKIVKFTVMPEIDRPIYAFNGGRFFVTANHPFKTTTGWKALDPESARRDHPGVTIGKLGVGDELITINGPIRLYKIESKTIHSVVYSPETDGTHEYYADGFLAHNKISQ